MAGFINNTFISSFPLGTLVVNFLGAVIMGSVSEVFKSVSFVSPLLISFVTAGILGGFTTFSTFSLETVNLIEGGKVFIGCMNILLSVALCLGGILLGKYIVKMFI